MRILVTGASGFLGAQIARQLVQQGHAVRALARPGSPRAQLSDVKVEWSQGDVLDRHSIDVAVDGCEAVIHAAANLSTRKREFALQRQVNVDGTRNVLEAARAAKVKRFIFTSSVATIGRSKEGTIADEATRFDWPVGFNYHETKREAEALVQKADGLATICLNPAVVLGPGEPSGRLLPLVRATARGLVKVVPPGGTTLCDVRDVAAAHVAALERGTPGERYILGGAHVTYEELVRLIAEAVGARPPIFQLSQRAIQIGALPLLAIERLGVPLPVSPIFHPTLVAHAFYSSDKAIRELAYAQTPARQSLADQVAWYRTNGRLN